MPSSEEDQVRRFRRGTPGAFEEIFAQHGGRVFRTCLRLCGNAADAEDLTSETFLAAYQGLDRFEGRSSVATWLIRIAYRKWSAMRGSPHRFVDLLEETVQAPPQSINDVDFERAAAGLTALQREAFFLVKIEGLRYREAAEALSVPQGTVQSRVHEAMVRLREMLSEKPSAGGGGSE
jgi:RNA polymerase sigma factor (sigma-70 family)